MQAKDIRDRDILGAIEALDDGKHWVNKRALYERIGEPPLKVFFAKLSKLSNRGLAEGCDLDWCGCWSVTAKGREYLSALPGAGGQGA